MNLSTLNTPSSRKGQSFVELAMVLPVILLLVLGGVEYTNLYVQGLRAAAITREAGNMAFRECRGLPSQLSNPPSSQLQVCMDRVVQRMNTAMNHMLPKFYDTIPAPPPPPPTIGGGGCNCGDDDPPPPPPPVGPTKKGTLILTCWGVGLRGAVSGVSDDQPVPAPVTSGGGGCSGSTTTGGNDAVDSYGNPIQLAQSRTGDLARSSKIKLPTDFAQYGISNAFFFQKGGYMFVAEIYYKYDPITAPSSFYKGDGTTRLLPEDIYQSGFF